MLQEIEQNQPQVAKQIFTCDNCGTQFTLDPRIVNKGLKCGQCGQAFNTRPASRTQQTIKRRQKTMPVIPTVTREKLSLPGYKIVKILGKDPTGRTYKALSRTDKKKVIIKVLNEETKNDREFMAQMENAVKSSLSVEIPNIRKNFGILKHDKYVFVVSEYIEGESLYHILQRNVKIPWIRH